MAGTQVRVDGKVGASREQDPGEGRNGAAPPGSYRIGEDPNIGCKGGLEDEGIEGAANIHIARGNTAKKSTDLGARTCYSMGQLRVTAAAAARKQWTCPTPHIVEASVQGRFIFWWMS